MAEVRDVDRSLRLARQVFSPSSESQTRVRAAVAARMGDSGSPTLGRIGAGGAAALSAGGALKSASVSALKASALVGVGFALGVWFTQTGPLEHTAPGAADHTPHRALAPASSMPEGAPPSATPTHGQAPPSHPSAVPTPHGTVSSRATTPLEPPGADPQSGDSASPRVRAEASHPATRWSPASRHGTPKAGPDADGFAEELALLQRAERALRSKNPALARGLIAELEARFPKTAWREERAAVLVLAGCALQEPHANAQARAFLERHATSVYIDRITSVCGLGASEPGPMPP